jgi:CubicO group peptidase (beta-lactamase class C family)
MKRIRRFLLVILFVRHPFSGNGQTFADSTDSNQPVRTDSVSSLSLREAAESIRIVRGVPGMVYAVFSKDSIFEFQTLGYRVFKQKDPIEKNDRFNIGTNTAAITAYVAARLVEAGKIKWTTPLLEVFPGFRKKTLPVYKSIRFQDLLSSRTRLQPFMEMSDWFKIPDIKGNIVDKRLFFTYWILQRKPNMENFNQQKIVFSLAGYVIAASMMEKVTGKSWEDLVTEYVRKPLNITTRYSWPNRMDLAAPAGHWFQGGSFHSEDPDTWVKVHPILYPGQGISISMPDYIRFMQYNLQGLAEGKTHLSQSEFEFLYFGLPDFSMGWNNGSYFGQSFAFHEGLSLLFNCRTEIIKEKDRCIIVMCNSGDKDGRGAVLDLTKLLEEKYF